MTPALQKLIKDNPALYKALVAQAACEQSLHSFLKGAWDSIETTPFQDNWHLHVVCTELEKVTRGECRFCLINLPPRCSKTTIVSICWPIWTWLQRERSVTSGPGVRFLCASYGDRLTLENADKMRELLGSTWFNDCWGDRIKIRSDRNMKSSYYITEGGGRISTSISGSLLGLGGDVIVVDDPHNTESVESDAEREQALRGWRELSSTRLNDPQRSALVVVMQRLHQSDVSGVILDGPDSERWAHVMLPMRHEIERHCPEDPRTEEGELMWPDRFGEREVAQMERDLGPYMASGRLQQSPSPTGGGIIKRDYWKLWPEDDAGARPEEFSSGQPVARLEYPAMEYVIASVDTAYTTKQENDFNALSIIGLWRHRGLPRLMLMHCWKKRLEMRGDTVPRIDGETKKQYIERSKPSWGMLEWTAYECARFGVDELLIENKATGITLSQEFRKVYSDNKWGVRLVNPQGDKVARAYSVQHLFAEGMVYAPDRDWADQMISSCAIFPKGAHDDDVDSLVQGIKYLRDTGWALRREEVSAEDDANNEYVSSSASAPLYDV